MLHVSSLIVIKYFYLTNCMLISIYITNDDILKKYILPIVMTLYFKCMTNYDVSFIWSIVITSFSLILTKC